MHTLAAKSNHLLTLMASFEFLFNVHVTCYNVFCVLCPLFFTNVNCIGMLLVYSNMTALKLGLSSLSYNVWIVPSLEVFHISNSLQYLL